MSPDAAALRPMDELASMEATDVPPAVDLGPDPYIEDPNYDTRLTQIDPEEQGADLPTSPEEWPS